MPAPPPAVPPCWPPSPPVRSTPSRSWKIWFKILMKHQALFLSHWFVFKRIKIFVILKMSIAPCPRCKMFAIVCDNVVASRTPLKAFNWTQSSLYHLLSTLVILVQIVLLRRKDNFCHLLASEGRQLSIPWVVNSRSAQAPNWSKRLYQHPTKDSLCFLKFPLVFSDFLRFSQIFSVFFSDFFRFSQVSSGFLRLSQFF